MPSFGTRGGSRRGVGFGLTGDVIGSEARRETPGGRERRWGEGEYCKTRNFSVPLYLVEKI